jgi:hypothetical protein
MLLQSQQLQEHLDHEFGARYDDIRERYASDIASMEGADEEHSEYMQTVYDAGYGDNDEAYEANWKRTREHAELNLN